MKKYVLLFLTFTCTYYCYAQSFTANNFIVYRLSSSSAITNPSLTGYAAYIDEYNVAGNLIQSVALPIASSGTNKKFVGIHSLPDGIISRSMSKEYIIVPGYEADVNTSNVPTTTAANYRNRIIATIKYDKTINTSTAIGSTIGNDVSRSATSNDGSQCWVATSGSLSYATTGSSTNTTLNTNNGFMSIKAFGNELYGAYRNANGQSFSKVVKIGSGLPSATNTSISSLAGLPASTASSQIVSFFLVDVNASIPGPDVLYTAMDASAGIKKYALNNTGTWEAKGTIASSNLVSIDGFVADAATGSVRLFANTPTGLYTFVDNTGHAGTIPNTATLGNSIVTVSANNVFKSVCISPEINPLTNINSINANRLGITFYPNPVQDMLSINNLKPQDKWQTLSLMSIDGKTVISNFNIQQHTNITINMQQLPKGSYVVHLHRKNGKQASFNVVKN